MKHVLFADPNRDLLSSYSALLSDGGHHVATAFDGTEVIRKTQETAFDLVILGERIPRVSAKELISLIHETGTPVLLLTTGTLSFPDADAVLPFPFLPSELFAAADRLTRNQLSRQAGES